MSVTKTPIVLFLSAVVSAFTVGAGAMLFLDGRIDKRLEESPLVQTKITEAVGKETGFRFGGLYQVPRDNPEQCYVPNPITEACSCPPTYTQSLAGRMADNDPQGGRWYSTYLCWKK